MKKYVFNHYYLLKHDERRTFLLSRNYNESAVDVNVDWISCIHPVYAMILSFFSEPITLSEAVGKVSFFFEFSKDYTSKLLNKFIGNIDVFHINYSEHNNNFPKNLIIQEEKQRYKIRHYDPSMFIYKELDFKRYRMYTSPLYITFMVSNHCLTDCIYCYADRETRCKNMDFSQVERIIDEAYKQNMKMFSLDGGEFFLYPYWRELLEKLREREFRPELVSTKYPVKEKDIIEFSKYKILIQVSLDSLNQNILDKMVGHIKDYSSRMCETLRNLDKYMNFQVATILTKYNCDISGLEQMYEYFCSFKHFNRWEIRVGFKSLYSKADFGSIKISRDDIDKVQKWVELKKREHKLNILWSPGREVTFFKAENGGKDFIGNHCSANSLNMFILPDGKVTLCEQLYWKKNFIIGDLTENSITEVWHSPRALFLANMPQTEYSEDSACRKCNIFNKCKEFMNNCYVYVLKVYGENHWDYPDPRCKKAPRAISDKLYV